MKSVYKCEDWLVCEWPFLVSLVRVYVMISYKSACKILLKVTSQIFFNNSPFHCEIEYFNMGPAWGMVIIVKLFLGTMKSWFRAVKAAVRVYDKRVFSFVSLQKTTDLPNQASCDLHL